ncbi:MAG: zinc ribbon domain-containing protein [Pyrinomonadaceae bacterium]
MFCPTCGSSVSEGLKYCKSCGGRLSREMEENDAGPGKMLNHLLTSLVFIVVFGMGILVGLVAVMLGKEVKTEVVMMVVFVYLLAIFGICFSLARQIPKLIDARLKRWENTTGGTHQLASQTMAQLAEFREPAMSVTDHTTKTLDKIPVAKR